MNLRLRRWLAALQEIEIAALIGLADMSRIHGAVTPRITWWRRRPRRAASRKFIVSDVQMNLARRDIDLDFVAGFDQRQRAADKTLRCHVQDARAVARAAHTCVGNAQHVAHAALEELLGNWQFTPFR